MQITYGLNLNIQKLVFEENALEHLKKFQQISDDSTEAGGQLFATIDGDEVRVKIVTGPYKEDDRKRFHFLPFRKKSQQDIKRFFNQGLHYIGDWHTHPQDIPTPSGQDNFSMKDKYLKSKHELKAFVMVIVGKQPFPEGLWVSLHDAKFAKKLDVID